MNTVTNCGDFHSAPLKMTFKFKFLYKQVLKGKENLTVIIFTRDNYHNHPNNITPALVQKNKQ